MVDEGSAKPATGVQVCTFVGATIGIVAVITLNRTIGLLPDGPMGGAISGAIGGGGAAMLG